MADIPRPKTITTIKSMHSLLGGSQQVFYNRVPKCASELTRTVIDTLSERNGFHFHKGTQYLKYVIDEKQQVIFAVCH